MKKETKTLLIKYLVYFGIAALITVGVFAIKGFFGDSVAVNIQILADGFTVSGLLLSMFAGMIFISSEGALIGIGFVLKSVVQFFLPMGRKNHEFYAQYRERKLSELKKPTDYCALVIGLAFLFIGIIFNVIWYVNFYNVTA